jgi:hypothetical protein
MSGPWRMCRVWCSTLVSVPPKLGTDHRKFRPRPRPANMLRVSPHWWGLAKYFIRYMLYPLSPPRPSPFNSRQAHSHERPRERRSQNVLGTDSEYSIVIKMDLLRGGERENGRARLWRT